MGSICEGCGYCEVTVFSYLKTVAPGYSDTLVNVHRLLHGVTCQITPNSELRNLYSSSKVIKARNMKWVGLVARTGQM